MKTKRTICLLCVITMLLQLAMPLLSFAAKDNKPSVDIPFNSPEAHWSINQLFTIQDLKPVLELLGGIDKDGNVKLKGTVDKYSDSSLKDTNTINWLLKVKYSDKNYKIGDSNNEVCIVRASAKTFLKMNDGSGGKWEEEAYTNTSKKYPTIMSTSELSKYIGKDAELGCMDLILYKNKSMYYIQVITDKDNINTSVVLARDISSSCSSEYDIPDDILNFLLNKEASDLKSAQSQQAQYNPSKGDFVAKLYNHMKNDGSPLESKERQDMVQSNQYRELIIMDNIYRYAEVLNVPQKYFTADTLTPDTTGDNLNILAVANEVALSYDDMATSISGHSPENTAYLFDTLVKYQMGRVTGVQEQNVEDGIMADKLIYSDDLNDILPATSEIKGRVFNPEIFSALSSKKVKPHTYSLHEYEKLAVLLQDIEDYSVEATQDDSTLTKYITEDCKKNEDSTMNYPPIKDGDLIRKIKSYVAIKNGLAYLGINPWIDTLQKIVQTVDKYHLDEIVAQEDFNDYDTNADKEPLRAFFDVSRSVLSPNYLMGVALSSTFIPLQTNVYEVSSIRILKDKDWLKDFHVKYAFNRKALLMDSNYNAAVDQYVSGVRGNMQVATLRDLLQYKRDIVLYIDDNFYNADKVAEMTDKVYNQIINTEESGEKAEVEHDWDFSSDIDEVLKTGPNERYPNDIVSSVTPYGENPGIINTIFGFDDKLLMKTEDIKTALNNVDYTIKKAYSVVSAIYRHAGTASVLNTQAGNQQPVFVSSPKLWGVDGITRKEFNSIYNYAMLMNLEASLGVDYKSTLDLDNPIYMDIYGNIVSESGLVIIPAASNPTLQDPNLYTPYTIGFLSYYAKGNWIKSSNDNLTEFFDGTDFEWDPDTEYWVPKMVSIDGVPIDPQNLSVSKEDLINALFSYQMQLCNKDNYIFGQRAWVITEVLRGAPIEAIDKTQEGIIGKRDVNKYGLYMSVKLDELANKLIPTLRGNSLISMPNVAFMQGVEYVVVFAFKILMLIFVAYILFNIYTDAVGGTFGLRTFGKCIATIAVFCILIYSVPEVVSASYNNTNRIFLQNEVSYINLINQEKSLEGREISAVKVDTPQSQTKLYLKVDKINVPWYKVLKDVMFAPVTDSVSTVYQEAMKDNYLYGIDKIQLIDDAAYIDIQDLYDSSTVAYNKSYKFIYQNINESPTASYFMPYYYMLDQIIATINLYNKQHDITNISTKIVGDGSVKTMGMIGDYLLSKQFFETDPDPLGLYDLYGISTGLVHEDVDIDNLDDSITQSLWYAKNYYDDEDISSRIDQLYSNMRAYVVKNRFMIGRVSDETFLKSMILNSAVKHNNLFRIPSCREFEVFNVDSRDLIRVSITDKANTVASCTYSFGKFIYDQTGGLGVILCAVLMGLYFITSVVKPFMIVFLCGLLVYALIIKNMIQGSVGKSVQGTLYTLSCMTIINVLYAGIFKLSMVLPSFGVPPLPCLIWQCVLQVIYLILAIGILKIILSDIADVGYNRFRAMIGSMIPDFGNPFNNMNYAYDGFGPVTSRQNSFDIRMNERDNARHQRKSVMETMAERDAKRENAQEESDDWLNNLFTEEKDK